MSRNPALDGLRGVAVLLVVLYHACEGGPWPFTVGWSGVDLFFALSGYLITTRLLLTRDRADYWPRFWRRRGARILPLYGLVLGLVGLARVTGLDPSPAAPWWSYATFTANWWMVRYGYGTPLLMVGWSLCVEEQFYATWPLVVRCVPSRAALTGACVAVLVISPLLRWGLVASTSGQAVGAVYVCTLTRLDALAVGALVALRPFRVFSNEWNVAAAFAVAGTLVQLQDGEDRFSVLGATLGYSATAIGWGAWVHYAVTSRPRWLAVPILRWLGDRAFGLYLLHYPAIWLAGPVWGPFIAAVLADLSWRWIERPALRRWS